MAATSASSTSTYSWPAWFGSETGRASTVEVARRLLAATDASASAGDLSNLSNALSVLAALPGNTPGTITREEYASFLLRHGPEDSCAQRATLDLCHLSSFFHGAIDRDTAISRLAGQRVGSFLVRIATDRGKFAVSYVVGGGRTEHSLIEPHNQHDGFGYVLLLDDYARVLQPTVSAAIAQDKVHFASPIAPPAPYGPLHSEGGPPVTSPPYPMVRSASAPMASALAGPQSPDAASMPALHPSLAHAETAPSSLVDKGAAGGHGSSALSLSPADAAEISKLMMPFSDKLKKALTEMLVDLLGWSSGYSVSSSSLSGSDDEDPLTQSPGGSSSGGGAGGASKPSPAASSVAAGIATAAIRRSDEELLAFLKTGTSALHHAPAGRAAPSTASSPAAATPRDANADRRRAFAFHSKQAQACVAAPPSASCFVKAAQHYAAACLHAIILRHSDVATDCLIQVGLCLTVKAFLRKLEHDEVISANAAKEGEVKAGGASGPGEHKTESLAGAVCALLNLSPKKWAAVLAGERATEASKEEGVDADGHDDGNLLFPSGHHGFRKLKDYADACLRTAVVLANYLDAGWKSEPLYRTYAGLFLVHTLLAVEDSSSNESRFGGAGDRRLPPSSSSASSSGDRALAEQALKAHTSEAHKLKKDPLFSASAMPAAATP